MAKEDIGNFEVITVTLTIPKNVKAIGMKRAEDLYNAKRSFSKYIAALIMQDNKKKIL